jgi:hypothetical protein
MSFFSYLFVSFFSYLFGIFREAEYSAEEQDCKEDVANSQVPCYLALGHEYQTFWKVGLQRGSCGILCRVCKTHAPLTGEHAHQDG